MSTQAAPVQQQSMGGAIPVVKAARKTERMPITRARSVIGQLVTRVHIDKDRIVLEKSGIPVAVLIDIEEYEKFLAFVDAHSPEKAA